MVFFSFDDASLRLCLCYAFAVIKLLLIRTFAWSKREKNPHNYNNSISVFSIRSWPSWPITKARNWGKKKVCIVYSLKTWLEMTFYCLIFFFHAQLGYWRQTHCQVSTACYFPMYDVFKNPFKSLPPRVLQGFCMDEDRGFGDVDSGVSKLDLFCLCFSPLLSLVWPNMECSTKGLSQEVR